MKQRKLLREFSIDKAGLNNVISRLNQILNSEYEDEEEKEDAIYLFCEDNFDDIQAGSSRIVCEYDESTVIKIAKPNGAGEYQNELEYETCTENSKSPLFPRAYFHSEDFQWIVTERVVVAKYYDFETIVGLPLNSNQSGYFEREVDKDGNVNMVDVSGDYEGYKTQQLHHDLTVCEFIDIVTVYKDEINKGTTKSNITPYEMDIMNQVLKRSQFFRDLANFIFTTDTLVGDLKRPENWGVAIRNGQPTMVIIDSGLDFSGFYQLYR